MDKKKNDIGSSMIFCGIFFLFALPPVGIVLIIIGILSNKIKKEKESEMEEESLYEEDKQFSQEEIHAHDFTSINEDDISQSAVHEHKGWEANNGPIKYR